MNRAPAGRGRPYLRDEGAGPALVLVHGFGLSGDCWDEVAELLVGSARVLRPDLRGLGRSATLPGPYTVEQMADDLRDALDRLEIPRATIAGHSMGGVVAIDFARRYPERLAALALIDSRIDRDTPEQERNRLSLAARAERSGTGVIADAYVPRFFAPQIYRDRPDLVERAHAALSANEARQAAAIFAGSVRRSDGRGVLAGLNVPVTVVTGSDDAFFTVASQRRLAETARRGELVVVEGSGHMPMWEAPVPIAETMKALIARTEEEERA